MGREEIVKRLDSLTAAAHLILKEAADLKKSLSPISGRAPRKGRKSEEALQQEIAKAVIRRNKRILKSKPTV